MTAAIAIATLPLVSAVPPPRAVASRDVRLCLVLLAAGTAGLSAALGFALLHEFWPSVAAFGVALTALHLMFWCAGEPRENRDDEDADGGGGGGRPPQDPPPPHEPRGDGLDWAAFDAERARWEAERRDPAAV